jgi:DNA-binding NarL/FixJ family response regulator
MFNDFNNRDDRVSFFESGYDEEEIKTIAKHSNLVLSSAPKETLENSFLFTLFKDARNKEVRDKNIKKAIDMGFSQHTIAAHLKISQPTVSYVLKKANHD